MRAKGVLGNVGVSRLRSFLEARVEDSYRRNVARIVPLLQATEEDDSIFHSVF